MYSDSTNIHVLIMVANVRYGGTDTLWNYILKASTGFHKK
jgi:hypothetical protein